jgi:hypothetical protein
MGKREICNFLSAACAIVVVAGVISRVKVIARIIKVGLND